MMMILMVLKMLMVVMEMVMVMMMMVTSMVMMLDMVMTTLISNTACSKNGMNAILRICIKSKSHRV